MGIESSALLHMILGSSLALEDARELAWRCFNQVQFNKPVVDKSNVINSADCQSDVGHLGAVTRCKFWL